MPEQDSAHLPPLQPTVGVLAEWDVNQFLLEQIRNSNLQRIGSTPIDAPDLRLSSNAEFWRAILSGSRIALRWVFLTRFQIVDWYPRTPGRFYLEGARSSRRDAERYVKELDGVRFYDPDGKARMMTGGIGSVRFKPVRIDQEEHWLCTATSDGNCHSGIPLAIPNRIMQGIDTRRSNWYSVSGQVKFLPDFLEEYFRHSIDVPQLYVLVDSVSLSHRDESSTAVNITPVVFFTGSFQDMLDQRTSPELAFERRLDEESFGRSGQTANVTYVTCKSDRLDQLSKAADWLKWYVHLYKGKIVTNYDQQKPTFQQAPFSLQKVMNGTLNINVMREYNIEHADIVCDTVERIHSEAITMTQIDVKLGNGVTIHGDFVVAQSIKDSFNKAATSSAPDDLKKLLTELSAAVGKMAEQMPKDTAQELGQDLTVFVEEAVKPNPREKHWQLSAEELKKAAQNIGDVGKPVLELAAKIVPILMSIHH